MSACGHPAKGESPEGHQGPGGWTAVLLLLAALAVFFWPAVLGGRVLLPADLVFDLDPLWWHLTPDGYTGPSNALLADQVYQFLPWRLFATRWVRAGRIPLWNPYTDAGLPFVGNAQSAIFSPFNLIGYLVPFYTSFTVTVIFRLFIAGFFTFLFAREIGLGRYGALMAAMTFPLSGPMIGWLGHPHSAAIAWLPAMFFAAERALTRESIPYAMLCGCIIGAQFLGGHPETSFHMGLAWGAYALYRAIAITGWRPIRLFPQLVRVAAAGLIGVLLAAVQLVPFAEALFHSAALSVKSATGETANWASRLLFEWHEWPGLLLLFLPQYFGTPLDNSYWYPYSNYVELNAYAGILPLVLAAAVVYCYLRQAHSPHRSLVLFFALMAVFSLGIAIRMPLLNIVNYLPLFSLAANGRLRLIYVFAVAILAGMGVDRIAAGDMQSHRRVLYLLLILAVLSLVLIAAAYAGLVLFKDKIIRSGYTFIDAHWGSNPYLNRPREYYYALVEERYAKKLSLYRPDHVAMYLPVLIALAWFALRSGLNRPLGRKVFPWGMLALTFVDLCLVGMPFNPKFSPQDVLPTPGAVRFLQQDRSIYRVCGTGLILYPNVGMVFGLQDVRGYDTVVPSRYAALVDRIDGHYRHHFHSLFTRADSPLLDLLNVKYLLTDQEPGKKWELVYQDAGTVRVYRNRDVLPRAFVVYRAEVVVSAAESLERLAGGGFNFRQQVILEERPAGWTEPAQIPPIAPEVRFISYGPNRVLLEVKTDADGLLILTDNYAPGWKALLDGQPTHTYVADHAFRAVVVPTGRHQVEFIYQPMSFWIGAAVTLLTIFALLIGLLWFRLKSKQKAAG